MSWSLTIGNLVMARALRGAPGAIGRAGSTLTASADRQGLRRSHTRSLRARRWVVADRRSIAVAVPVRSARHARGADALSVGALTLLMGQLPARFEHAGETPPGRRTRAAAGAPRCRSLHLPQRSRALGKALDRG